MNTLGVIVLAAATATGGIGKPHVWKSLFKPGILRHGPPPSYGPITAPPVDRHVMGAGMGAPGFGAQQRRFATTTSQVFFVEPDGMEIGWQTSNGGAPTYLDAQLTAPARYNFRQGYIYRLKLSNIAQNPGLVLYPTIEVAPSTPATDAYLTHNPIPIQFTPEDFDQVRAGNFVTKVVYLPDPKFQEPAIAGLYGAETIVSTRLEPGVDPILEADKRGTILLIVRVGAIDLEMPANGAAVNYGTAPTGSFYDVDQVPSSPPYSAPMNDLPPPPASEMREAPVIPDGNDGALPEAPDLPDGSLPEAPSIPMSSADGFPGGRRAAPAMNVNPPALFVNPR